MRVELRDAEWGPVELHLPDGTPLPEVGENLGLEYRSGGSEYTVIRRAFTYFKHEPGSLLDTPCDEVKVTLYLKEANEDDGHEQRSRVHEPAPEADPRPGDVPAAHD